jgi:ABC-type uncharacterized transport system substrate-binding protein
MRYERQAGIGRSPQFSRTALFVTPWITRGHADYALIPDFAGFYAIYKRNVPAVYWVSAFARDGGLLSYGVDQADIFRRAATYVDRILRGEKPGDLPVQLPTKFEMVVNRKTANALGLTVPPSIMLRADEVID